MGKHQEERLPIREVIRDLMAEREHTIRDAEEAMGMQAKTLRRIVTGQTMNPGRGKMEQIAGYLGIPVRAAGRWFKRDVQRIRAYKGKQAILAELEGPTLTWFGVVDVREQEPGCRKCDRQAACRQAADAGLPLPCERLLAREIVPEHALAQMEVEL
jgi:transcriptional regulator with XRE-family HTH domain